MLELRKGLEEGLDVSVYADPKYDWRQMREICHDLEVHQDRSAVQLSKPTGKGLER